MEFFTTPQVYDEIKHIKKNHDALGILIETKRLNVIEPEKKYSELIIKMAKATGDFRNLSKEDISSIALCLQLNGEIITDDFAISNVSESLGLKTIPLMTNGITDKGKWVYYCPGCHKNFSDSTECPICGNKLRKKLLRDKTSIPINK
jgi:endoribonuclease Nob1